MKIKGNTVVDDEGNVICTFNPETYGDRDYPDDTDKAAKLAIGRFLKPYKEQRKQPDEPTQLTDQDVKTVASAVVTGKVPLNRETMLGPAKDLPNCPPYGAAGDKTEEVVWFVYNNHPEYYKIYYNHRLTCVDTQQAQEKSHWESVGAEYFNRGLKITDIPHNATASQKMHFENGYKKYMLSEIDLQSK